MENQNNSIPAPFMIVMNSHPAATDTQLSAKIRPTAFLALSNWSINFPNWKDKFFQLGIFLYIRFSKGKIQSVLHLDFFLCNHFLRSYQQSDYSQFL